MPSTLPLPAEIRDLIYAELFTFSEPLEILRRGDGRFSAGHMRLEPSVTRDTASSEVFVRHSWSGIFLVVGTRAASLLRVSKATSAEARRVLYGANTFALDLRLVNMHGRWSVQLDHFADLPAAIGAANAALVRRASTSLLAGALFDNRASDRWGELTWKGAGERAAERLCESFPVLEVLDMHLDLPDMPGLLPTVGVPGLQGSNHTNRMVSIYLVDEKHPRGRWRPRRKRRLIAAGSRSSQLAGNADGAPAKPTPPQGEEDEEEEWPRSYFYREFVRRLAGSSSEYSFPSVSESVAAMEAAVAGFAAVIRSRPGRELVLRTVMREVMAGYIERAEETRQFLDALAAATQREGWQEIGVVQPPVPEEE